MTTFSLQRTQIIAFDATLVVVAAVAWIKNSTASLSMVAYCRWASLERRKALLLRSLPFLMRQIGQFSLEESHYIMLTSFFHCLLFHKCFSTHTLESESCGYESHLIVNAIRRHSLCPFLYFNCMQLLKFPRYESPFVDSGRKDER